MDTLKIKYNRENVVKFRKEYVDKRNYQLNNIIEEFEFNAHK